MTRFIMMMKASDFLRDVTLQVDLYRGDAEQVLASFAPQSVDAVVTDPPYGLARGRQPEAVLREWMTGRRQVPSRSVGFAGELWDAALPGPSVWRAAQRVLRPGAHLAVFGHASTLDLLAVSMRLGGLEIVDQLVWMHGQGWPRPHPVALEVNDDVAASLKPAATPILLARAPIEDSFSNTWEQHGTGLLRLATTRVGHRHPANVVISHEPACSDEACVAGCPVEMLDAHSGRLKARGNANPTRSGGGSGASGPSRSVIADHGRGDWGGASRFFYCARPSMAERNAGLGIGEANEHPSVKPVALMRHLVQLLTPPGGTVLDPFVGTGTTAVAATETASRCIGIDRDGGGLYLQVAAARVRHAGSSVRLHDGARPEATDGGTESEVAENLRLAARRLRRAEHRAAALRAERDALVAQARDAKLTWREIASLSGLSSPQAAERVGRSAAPDG